MTAKRELISLEEFPSMAAPWSSEDEGEGWQWGDFLISIQKKPITIGEVFAKISGTKVSIPMTYHYAAVVFYHPNSNPHGKSVRPILSVGIEQMDATKLMAAIASDGIFKENLEVPNDMPIMVGLFNAELRLNLGEYEEGLDIDSCRSKFFDVIKNNLKLDGYPNKLGNMQAIKQIISPAPSTPTPTTNSNSGCLGALVLMVLIPAGIWSSANYFF